jgi:hypothetical protein
VRYWWVNQNQTFRHEVTGGFLWSPKRNANGARNPFYETMREVSPGDIVLSFVDTRIEAIGIAQSYCWESPKPREFGSAGQNWEDIGWKVLVGFQNDFDVRRAHVLPQGPVVWIFGVWPRFSPFFSIVWRPLRVR